MFFFFFQAEDGIRDHCVTGVQTCALPILYGIVGDAVAARALADRVRGALGPGRHGVTHDPVHGRSPRALPHRSEERRVGKECSKRWSTVLSKKRQIYVRYT